STQVAGSRAMAYSSSYNSSIGSSVNTGIHVSDDSSSSSLTIGTAVTTSSPDDSDGLSAAVGGEALAIGEDTLALGDVSGTMIDDGNVTSVDLSATMIAGSEAGEGDTAFASADTFA